VDIGKRLRELREANGLSQGDVEDRTGLLRIYVSQIENGHSTPTLQVLEKWAAALDVELYQLFVVGHGETGAPVRPEKIPGGAQERTLLGLFGQMPIEDRALLISLAREIVKRKGERG
jgi:transcriptional regulator with XRE-family HTH domain